MGKIAALFKLFKAGEEVGNAAAWTNRTIIVNVLVAVLGVAAAFGFKVDLDTDTLTMLAGGIVAAVTAGNAVMHAITDHRAGVGVQPDSGTDVRTGGVASGKGTPGDIHDEGGA